MILKLLNEITSYSVITACCSLFTGGFSTGPNESCEDLDRQANTEYLKQNTQKEGVTAAGIFAREPLLFLN